MKPPLLRRSEAAARIHARTSRSASEQLDILDSRLGFDVGARRERDGLKRQECKEADISERLLLNRVD